VAELGARFALVRLPMKGDSVPEDPCRRTLCQIAKDADVPYLDVSPAFLAREPDGPPVDGPWFLPDGHYDAAGNEVVAEAVAELLVERFGLRRRLPPAGP
jgi:lysophospholipase L1-like esterase